MRVRFVSFILFHIKLITEVILPWLEKESLLLSFCQQSLATQDILFLMSTLCLKVARSKPEYLPPFIRPEQVSPGISVEGLYCYNELCSGL